METQFQAYPWCGYSHLFFDTMVKPLEKEKENHINGAFMLCNLLARNMFAGIYVKGSFTIYPPKVEYQFCSPITNSITYISYYLKLMSINYVDIS